MSEPRKVVAFVVAGASGKNVEDAETGEIYKSQATPLSHRASKVSEA